jgi:preprotein translocase SecE subunit
VPAKASTTSRADQASRRLGSNSIGDFYRESVSELRKVTWPSWQDASNLTVAVIGMTVAIAAFLGLADEILNLAIKPILGQ